MTSVAALSGHSVANRSYDNDNKYIHTTTTTTTTTWINLPLFALSPSVILGKPSTCIPCWGRPHTILIEQVSKEEASYFHFPSSPLGFGAVAIVVRSLGLSGKLNTWISVMSATISLHEEWWIYYLVAACLSMPSSPSTCLSSFELQPLSWETQTHKQTSSSCRPKSSLPEEESTSNL